jgi:hypothetical protein
LVGNPGRNRPLGRPRRRSDDNIKVDIRKTGYGDVDTSHVVQDRDR